MNYRVMKSTLILILAAASTPAWAQAVDGIQQPLQLIEDVCVRASLAVNEARRGVDVTQRVLTLRKNDPSIRTEMLKRLEAAEIERGLKIAAQGGPWDANREAAACLDRNRHVALAYVTAE